MLVDSSEIHSKFTHLWNELEKTNQTRACLLNLVVYTHKNERQSYMHLIVQKLLENVPCRVIFISVDPCSSALDFKTSVSIVNSGTGLYEIVCDYLHVEASLKAESKLSLLILPHLVPDLPIYLLYGEDPVVNTSFLLEFEKIATRIIFDSEVTVNLIRFANIALKHKRITRCEIADLNWARLENWRNLLAATFKDPIRLLQLKKSNKMRITYNTFKSSYFSHTQFQALYLQAWIASQLNWSFIKQTANTLFYRNQTVELVEKEMPTLRPGLILGVEILNDHKEHFYFLRDEEHPEKVSITVCNPHGCDIPAIHMFPPSELGLAFIKELSHQGTSEHLLKVLGYFESSNPPFAKIILPGDLNETLLFSVNHLIDQCKQAILKKGFFTLALSGGSTPQAIFKLLCSTPFKEQIEWEKVHLFWSDERAVNKENPDSNYCMAMKAGFERMPLNPHHIHRMIAEEEIETNALSYEKEILKTLKGYPFDLIMLGIGEDGHTASLFPESQGLNVTGRAVVANYIPSKQIWRMTFTFETLNSAQNAVFYILGKSKQKIIQSVFSVDHRYPCQKVGQPNKPALWVLDNEAADLLPNDRKNECKAKNS